MIWRTKESTGTRRSVLSLPSGTWIAALRQLGRDTIEATVWPMNEAEALLLSRSQRMCPQESALEQGWLFSPNRNCF